MVENFIASRGQSNKVGKQEILHYNKKAVARVFHLKPSGYVVATLNRNEVPIKAYSFKGSFDKLPEEYKEFLSARLYEYSEMIEKAEKVQVVDSDYKKVWSYLENYTESSPKPMIETNILSIDGDGVVPALPKNTRAYTPDHEDEALLNTNWGQGYPKPDATATYNIYTPVLTSDKNHTLIGCAPLAWGQIMKHHEWPLIPSGTTDSYEWNGKTLFKYLWDKNRYDSTRVDNTYDWELMTNSLTSSQIEQKKAIGTLLADIGYALHADWGLDGTGAWTHDPNDALNEIEEHFGYSTNMRREVYLQTRVDKYPSNQVVNYDTFTNSIKIDVNNRQPLLFAFHNGDYGHATVADGYQNIILPPLGITSFEMHINFGWSGTDNDFYLFTETPIINNDPIDPVGSLTEAVIVAGIKPCTNSANDCASSFNWGGKTGLILKSGWNLISLIGDNDDINYRDFTNANSVYKFVNGQWQGSPTDIEPKDVLWVNHSGTTEYVFPGSQTSNVELNENDFTNIPSGSWVIGTGQAVASSYITDPSHDITSCKTYNVLTQQWVNCPTTIPAGSGIAVIKQ